MVVEAKLVEHSCRTAACRLGTPNLVVILGSPTGAAAEAHLEDRAEDRVHHLAAPTTG